MPGAFRRTIANGRRPPSAAVRNRIERAAVALETVTGWWCRLQVEHRLTAERGRDQRDSSASTRPPALRRGSSGENPLLVTSAPIVVAGGATSGLRASWEAAGVGEVRAGEERAGEVRAGEVRSGEAGVI